MSQSWESLVALALLGTDRQGTPPPITENGVKDILNQIDAADLEGWVLSAAGTLATYRQAGQTAMVHTTPVLPACEVDAKSFNPDSLPLFSRILESEFQPALPEFLDLLQQSGQCIPPEYLPRFLDWGYAHAEERSHLRAVVGMRGEWLAPLNPKWAYAQATPQSSDPDDWQALWDTSDRIVRLNLLRDWRSQNAAAACERLASTWKQEAARDRAAFLECLAVGLTMADEAFLETALGDRSKEVRAVAVELLSRLLESQLSQRIAGQAAELLQFKTVKDQLQIEVKLPLRDDPQWTVYEFKPQPSAQSQSKQGDRANLLLQILSITPLSTWERAASPAQLIQASLKQDWELILLQGWSIACQRQQNLDWAKALLTGLGQKSITQLQRSGLMDRVVQLLSLLPTKMQSQWITDWLVPSHWKYDITIFLNAVPSPWHFEFSQTLVRSIATYLESLKAKSGQEQAQIQHYLGYYILPSIVYALDPNIRESEEVSQLQRLYEEHRRSDLDRFLKILQFRQQMRQTLLHNGAPPG